MKKTIIAMLAFVFVSISGISYAADKVFALVPKAMNNPFFDLARDENYQFSWVAPDAQEDITHSFEDTSFRIVGSDYKNNFSFKHKYNHLLRNRPKGTEVDTHWSRYKGPIF